LEILFFNSESVKLHLDYKNLVKRFEKIAFFEGASIDCVNYIFVNDRSIYSMNEKFLHHSYPTDIITFDYSLNKIVSGDIYISIDTVKFNSKKYSVSFQNELNRVMIHGLLHLLGYKDKALPEKKLMRAKENYYLKLF
jgi:probable rRNA maturation factor